MFLTLALVALGGFGLLIGSFLNVVVARVPAGQSVAHPGSRCPRCLTPIAARDNVPVLSWALLRGRGRCCGEPISARYPVVEGATGLAFVLVGWWVAGSAGTAAWPLAGQGLPSPPAVVALLAMLYLVAVSIALALIDIDTKRLPFWIVAPSVAVGAVLLAASAVLAGERSAVVRMLIGAAALWAFYRVLHLVYPAGMGYGDVRLSALIGGYLAWLGYPQLAVGAFAAFLLGALGGIVAIRLGASRRNTIPYGPYMLAGLWIGLVVGEPLAGAYVRLAGLSS